jgi:hypothetical protein
VLVRFERFNVITNFETLSVIVSFNLYGNGN